jgi:hypothetical protein
MHNLFSNKWAIFCNFKAQTHYVMQSRPLYPSLISLEIDLSFQTRTFLMSWEFWCRIKIVTHVHTHTHTHTYTYIHTHTHTYIQTYMCTHARTHIHTYIHAYIHTHMHMHARTHIHTYIHIYIHTYTHTILFLCLIQAISLKVIYDLLAVSVRNSYLRLETVAQWVLFHVNEENWVLYFFEDLPYLRTSELYVVWRICSAYFSLNASVFMTV